MSSHDCRIEASISLKEGVTREQVVAALSEFLTYHNLDLADLERRDEADLADDGTLYLSIRVFGYGGHKNEQAEDLAKSLSSISLDGEFFEFFDDDTGDSDSFRTPYFLANPELGQLNYGIAAMREWIEPLIGKEQFDVIASQIKALPMKTLELTDV